MLGLHKIKVLCIQTQCESFRYFNKQHLITHLFLLFCRCKNGINSELLGMFRTIKNFVIYLCIK